MALDEPNASLSSLDEKAPVVDWEGLRRRSLQPGGFGDDRVEIWPQLLGISPKLTKEAEPTATADKEHQDERQIRLDTDRSFVFYPVDEPTGDRGAMQEKLNTLLVSIFRRHPRLNYFQGYHDIVSVLFLTLPEELQLACAEKISLHRVRDSMGSTLEPILGLLRVTKNLLRLADLEYALDLERSSKLPFYALSNLLTLFSHDIPTLPLIQHVFDYLLCRPPIAVVYLATAIVLSRKEEIRRLEEEDEDEGMGMAHSLLSALPPLLDGEETRFPDVKVEESQSKEPTTKETEQPNDQFDDDVDLDGKQLSADIPVKSEEDADSISAAILQQIPPSSTKNESLASEPSQRCTEDLATNSSSINSTADTTSGSPATPKDEPTPTPSPAPSRPHIPALDLGHRRTPITLASLLSHADELFELYPPTHSDLCLSTIMGPQSVVYTWSESPAMLPADDEAEAMVVRPELIVYPYIEQDDLEVLDEGEEEGEEWEEKTPKKRRFRAGKLRGKVKGKWKKYRRVRMEKKTGAMVVGAVLILGVAMAVYGVKMRGAHPGAGMYGFGLGSPEGHGREWKKVAGWVGGAVIGVTERVVSGLSASSSSNG